MKITPEAQRAVVRALGSLSKPTSSVEVPRYLHTGDDVKTLGEVAALMGKSLKTTARYVLETKGLNANLYLEAKRVLTVDKNDKTGVAIMLQPPEEDAQWITGTGEIATETEDLHVTVGYFGTVGKDDSPALPARRAFTRILGNLAEKFTTFDAKVSSMARFRGEEKDAVVLLLDAPEFEDIRRALMDSRIGQYVNRQHGYTPHMTLGYIEKDQATPEYEIPEKPITIDRIVLGWADTYSTAMLKPKPQPFESKSIRRVRTPEGARRFGQPIGTVIRRDLVRGNPLDLGSVQAARPKKVTLDADRLGPIPAKGESTFESHGYKWNREEPMGSSRYTKWRTKIGTTKGSASRTGANIVGTIIHDPYSEEDGTKSPYRWMVRKEGFYDNDMLETQWADSWEDAAAAMSEYVQGSGMVVFRKKRTDGFSAWDYDDGIYGKDWLEDGETPETLNPDNLPEDELALELAMTEAIRLGISYDEGEGRTAGGSVIDTAVSTQTMEITNAVMRSYEEMFPGFSDLLHTFRVDVGSGAIGSNHSVLTNRMVRLFPDHSFESAQKVGPTSIQLDSQYFNFDSGERGDRLLEMQYQSAFSSGFFVGDVIGLAKEHDIPVAEAATRLLLHHEIGHTVARAIFGELASQDMDHADTEATRVRYAKAVGAVLDKHGVTTGNGQSIISNANTVNIANTGGRDVPLPVGMDTSRLAQHVSGYGATNLHEMMAETWTSYMNESEITDFVQDMGKTMETLFAGWRKLHHDGFAQHARKERNER